MEQESCGRNHEGGRDTRQTDKPTGDQSGARLVPDQQSDTRRTDRQSKTEMELRIYRKWPLKSSVVVCITFREEFAKKCFGRDLASKLGCGRVWLVFLSQTVTNHYQRSPERPREAQKGAQQRHPLTPPDRRLVS